MANYFHGPWDTLCGDNVSRCWLLGNVWHTLQFWAVKEYYLKSLTRKPILELSVAFSHHSDLYEWFGGFCWTISPRNLPVTFELSAVVCTVLFPVGPVFVAANTDQTRGRAICSWTSNVPISLSTRIFTVSIWSDISLYLASTYWLSWNAEKCMGSDLLLLPTGIQWPHCIVNVIAAISANLVNWKLWASSICTCGFFFDSQSQMLLLWTLPCESYTYLALCS